MEHSKPGQPPAKTAMGEMPPEEARSGQEAGCKHFRILDLPDELIVRIIEYAVVTSSPKVPLRVGQWYQEQLQPAVTRTCRMFRGEGLPYFYKHNHFDVFEVADLCQWLQVIGRANAISAKHVKLIWLSEGSEYLEYNLWRFYNHLQEYLPFQGPEELEADEEWSAEDDEWFPVKDVRLGMHNDKVISSFGEKSLRWADHWADTGAVWYGYDVSLIERPEQDVEWIRILDLVAMFKDAPAAELDRRDWWIPE